MYIATRLNRFSPVAPLVTRVILGILFIYHGVDKFDAGLDNVEDSFDGWGVPFPGLTAAP